jgi:hypothetical protein
MMARHGTAGPRLNADTSYVDPEVYTVMFLI